MRFYGYFKESVVESRLENYRIRKLIIFYYLEDRSIQLIEPKQTNSGAPQGIFLKRQMMIKQDGSQMPFEPTDFRIGLDLGLCGRSIRIYDCDQYTREFFEVSIQKHVTLFRTLVRLNLIARLAPRTTLFTLKSQFQLRKIRNSLSTSRNLLVAVESPPRSNSWTLTERC